MLSVNETVARMLEELADLEDLRGTRYKPSAYRRAARNIRHTEEPVTNLREEGTLANIEGVGDAIRAKIIEALDTGTMSTLETLREEVPVDITTLKKVRGLGTKSLARLWSELGITTLDELEAAARQGKIGQLDGFGPKTVTGILEQVEHVREAMNRWLLSDLETAAETLQQRLTQAAPIRSITTAGSIRRRCPTAARIHLVAVTKKPEATLDAFTNLAEAHNILDRSPSQATVELVTGTPATLTTTWETHHGGALLDATGAPAHLEDLQAHAQQAGGSLTPQGLEQDGQTHAFTTETSLYEALDLPPIPPELREGNGEVQAAAEGTLPDLVTLSDIRGDLQMHTTYSDGVTDIQAMARKANTLGYDYILITDHGPSLGIANAPSEDELYQQRDEIQEINEEANIDTTVLWGVEANIVPDGLDVPEDMLDEMDLVVASMHDMVDDASDRIEHALEAYPVDILGHPTNRKLNRRKGNRLDLDRIVSIAEREKVALEINAQPKRLDLDWRDAFEHRDRVSFVISTDAHSPGEMEVMRFGVDQARKAWLPKGSILNAHPLEELVTRLGA